MVKRSDDDPSAWIAWVALLTLPPIAFGARLGWYGVRANLAPALYAELGPDGFGDLLYMAGWITVAGLVLGGLAAIAVGPHVMIAVGLSMLSLGGAGSMVMPGVVSYGLTALGAGITSVSVLAAAGVSSGGGAPGLRYATVVAIYAAANAAAILAPWLAEPFPWVPVAASCAPLAILPVPLLTWWLAKRRPRVPDEGATGRVAVIGGLLFVLLLSAHATWVLADPLYAGLPPGWQMMVNPAAVLVTAFVAILGLLALELAKLPARFGVMAGAGALFLSVGATLSWSMGAGAPALALLALMGMAEVFIYPWAYARMVSDTHWRLAGVFALLALLPAQMVSGVGENVGVLAAMVVSVLAIPIAALGWMADTWVFGDEPGPIERRRGRRR